MNEDEYQKAVLAGKELMESPLSLHNQPVSPGATYGYQVSDNVFLGRQWAKETGAYYFDALDFLDAVHQGDKKRISFYKNELRDKAKIITPVLALYTDKEQANLSTYWVDLFTELKKIWKNPLLAERRLVVPLQLQFGKMLSHAGVACFNFKPVQDAVDVIVLEQHAQKKGSPDYEKDLDYAKGVKLHASVWSAVMRQKDLGLLGIGTVNTFVNDKPICKRHNVCGVVASELARRLLKTDDPMGLVKSGINITNEEVDKLHIRNQKLEAKFGFFSLSAIYKDGERQ